MAKCPKCGEFAYLPIGGIITDEQVDIVVICMFCSKIEHLGADISGV